MDVVELCSGPLTVSILPTRGMGLWKAECDGVPVGWNAPVRRPVHPRHVNLTARNGLGWLDGFNELLCRCGLAFNGPPGTDEEAKSPIESQLTLHGRIANTPAHRVEVAVSDAGEGSISVTGVIDECTLFGPQLRLTSTVSVIPGSREIHVEDRVENIGGSETELQLLYHTNVGWPFLDEGATLHAPSAQVAPRDARAAEGIDSHQVYLGPTPGYAEQAYFHELLSGDAGETTVLLRNFAGDRGFSVSWQLSELPCFTVWKCTQAEQDGYVTGLEPGTNFPNFKTFERQHGRVMLLAPGEVHTCRMRIGVHLDAEQVSCVEQQIAATQSHQVPQVHPSPVAGLCPL